jgi:hypothetical protein
LFFEYFKLVEIVVVQVLTNVDERTFSTFSFMKKEEGLNEHFPTM